MISKNRISEVRKLHSKKFREELGLFIVEGAKSVKMLSDSAFETVEVFATEESFYKNESWLSAFGNVTLVTCQDMERMSTLHTPPEILAVCRQRLTLPPITDSRPVLALDNISDPGNLGTIIRTADWFGIKTIVCSQNCVELYNPKTIQATMGSFTNVDVHRLDLAAFLATCNRHRRVVGTFTEGKDISDFKFSDSDIIVIGNEANGISDEVAAVISDRITITKKHPDTRAESLNAGIAAAIVMYVWRQ